MKLRVYQENLIRDAKKAFQTGYKKILIVLPCGGGKTVCFADMSNKHVNKGENNYVWFLVHREELVDQTVQTFEDFGIDKERIFIGMVQTVSRNLTKYKKPTMIVFDEAHHASATTWKKIVDAFPKVPLVGLTATPFRLNGEPLGNVFEKIVEGVSSKFLIENNFLSEYTYYAPEIIEFADVSVKRGDFDLEEVTDLFIESKIVGDVEKYIDFNKKTIIYSPSIKFSEKLEKSIPGVVHFDGNTPKKTRKEIIEKFRKGEIRVLSNVNLIGEGFDVPDCDVVILLRPTMSLALFIQQSMRALRYKPNKHAIIYDLVGNVYRHNLPTVDREYSLEKKIQKTGEKDFIIRGCKNCFKVYKGFQRICPYCNFDNGQDQREIKIEKEKELIEIKELKIKERKKAKSFEELVEIGKQRGYKNPYFWAKKVFSSRQYKRKDI